MQTYAISDTSFQTQDLVESPLEELDRLDKIEDLRTSLFQDPSESGVTRLFRLDVGRLIKNLNDLNASKGSFVLPTTLRDALAEFGKSFRRLDQARLKHSAYLPLFAESYGACFVSSCLDVAELVEDVNELERLDRSGEAVDPYWKLNLLRRVRERSELTPYRLDEYDARIVDADMYEEREPRAVWADASRSIIRGQQCPDRRYMTVGMLRKIAWAYYWLVRKGWA